MTCKGFDVTQSPVKTLYSINGQRHGNQCKQQYLLNKIVKAKIIFHNDITPIHDDYRVKQQ